MDTSNNQIEHIVISGGGIWGLYAYGAVKACCESGFINLSNIKSYYGTSVGSIISVILSLKIDFETVDTYLIKRPWLNVIQNAMYNPIQILENNGVLHKRFFYSIFEPLLKSLDLDPNLTLQDLYEYNHTDLYIYTTEMNNYELIELSHYSHGDWKVVDAVYASCAIPFMFPPFLVDNKCYLDGGVLLNFPLSKCIDHGVDRNTILGIAIGNFSKNTTSITETTNIFNYSFLLFEKIFKKVIFTNETKEDIKHKIVMDYTDVNNMFEEGGAFGAPVTILDLFETIAKSQSYRTNIIQKGITETKQYLESWGVLENVIKTLDISLNEVANLNTIDEF